MARANGDHCETVDERRTSAWRSGSDEFTHYRHLDAAYVNLGEPQRDAQLESADFTDLEEFPKSKLPVFYITQRGKGFLDIEDELTIHSVTRKVILKGKS